MEKDFAHLHLHSQYSLLDGAIKFPELFRKAQEYGMSAVALTDHGNLFGSFEFYKEAKKAGIKPIIGCEVYVAPTSRFEKSGEKYHHLVLLVMNRQGYKNLSNLVTKAYFEGFYRKPRIDHELLDAHREGLIVLSGCLNGELAKSVLNNNGSGHGPSSGSGHGLKEALVVAAKYREMFGDRYYLEIQANRLPEQQAVNERIREIGKSLSIPVVATNDCHYLTREDSKPHDILLCIQTGTALNDDKRFKFKGDEFFLKSRQEMLRDIGGFEDALERTLEVTEKCNFELERDGYRFPVYEIEAGKSLDGYMADLARERLEERLRQDRVSEQRAGDYRERLERELEIIVKMGFSGYFLVVADFINFAKSCDIPVGPGRGSAAGSLVAYALGITDVDPIPYNLIFERFLNPERISMPDIDVDFCAERREEVIKYVTEKYGADKVAQIGTFGTMSAKAVVKDVGRVLGIPYADVDRVTKLIPVFRGKVFSIEKSVSEVPQLKELIQKSPHLQELIKIALPLENMVRHSSTHAAGIVISGEPLADYIPLYRGSRDEIVTQFDMGSVEELGFVKFDFLGLKTLTVIDKAIKFIRDTLPSTSSGQSENLEHGKLGNFSERGEPVEPQGSGHGDSEFDIRKISLDDQGVYKLLSGGRTRGVFQIESFGMKEVLTRLEPSCFEDIIAVLALYRPGPLDSGMVDEFIKRKHGQRRIDYPLPELKEILKDTYGLFVYQEQIMRTASVLADYSLGEADLLRRAMGKKKPEEMKAQGERFLEGAKRKGINVKKATEIFDAMEKFAEYSFNKSHSTAYALITYQTAYLKTHYPAEFMAALLSVEVGNTDKIIASIAECREMGIQVLAPDVNESMAGFTAVGGKIRFGLSAIKNIGDGAVQAIIRAREEGGKFKTIFDFCERADARKINRRALESLIKSGAFDSLGGGSFDALRTIGEKGGGIHWQSEHCSTMEDAGGKGDPRSPSVKGKPTGTPGFQGTTRVHRAKLMEGIESLITYTSARQKSSPEGQSALFALSDSIPPPSLPDVEEWGEKEKLRNEMDVLGFYVTSHPMEKYLAEIKKYTNADTEVLSEITEKRDVSVAGIVRSLTVKHTKNGSGIFGNLLIEDMKGSVEVVVFNDLLRKSLPVLEDKIEPVIVRGTVEPSEERTRLRASDIFSLREMRNGSVVHISLAKGNATQSSLLKLKGIVEAYPGQSQVHLHLETDGGEAVVELGDFRVDIRDEFIEEVERLFGGRVLRLG